MKIPWKILEETFVRHTQKHSWVRGNEMNIAKASAEMNTA